MDIFNKTIHNINNITGKASDDGCNDEMTWTLSGYGGPCCNWILSKPGVNKAGQMVMIYDIG